MIDATHRLAFWKIVVVALCLCVFVFGTHARLMQYQTLPTNGIVASVGLWETDHRMEVRTELEVASLVVLAIICWTSHLLSSYTLPLAVLDLPSPPLAALDWNICRFFRPPPAF